MGTGFQVAAMNQMLNNLSQAATWERATVCPCKSVRTGGANVACLVCKGNGLIWDSPVACRIALESMKSAREFAKLGLWEKGDIMVTLPSDSEAYDAGEWDRFTLLDSTIRIDQVLTRGGTDLLKYAAIVSIDSIWGIVGGVRVDATQGLHFTLTDNQLTWIGSPILPIGTQYTILYVAHPSYYIFADLVTDRPHGSQALPRKVHCRLMELYSQALVK